MQLVHVWIPNSPQLLQPHLPPNCDQVRTGRTQLPLIINATVSKCSTGTNFIQTYKHEPHENGQLDRGSNNDKTLRLLH